MKSPLSFRNFAGETSAVPGADEEMLDEGATMPPLWKIGTRAKIELGYRQKVAKLKLAEAIFKSECCFHLIGSRDPVTRASCPAVTRAVVVQKR